MQSFIAGVLAKAISIIGTDLLNWLKKIVEQIQRTQKQKEAGKKVEADQGKPRSPEVDQHEIDDINS